MHYDGLRHVCRRDALVPQPCLDFSCSPFLFSLLIACAVHTNAQNMRILALRNLLELPSSLCLPASLSLSISSLPLPMHSRQPRLLCIPPSDFLAFVFITLTEANRNTDTKTERYRHTDTKLSKRGRKEGRGRGRGRGKGRKEYIFVESPFCLLYDLNRLSSFPTSLQDTLCCF